MPFYGYIQCGKTIVGTFTDTRGRTKILRLLAPGCGAEIKKGYAPAFAYVPKQRGADTARQQTEEKRDNVIREAFPYNRIRYLKLGDFKL